MNEILKYNISDTLNILRKREISVFELTKLYISAIEQTQNLNMYLEVSQKKALSMAKICDENYKNKTFRSLEGIPIGVKDMFCTNGEKTTASSKILENFQPTYESTVTKNLWDNGAVQLGKLSCDEFAMGSSNETSFKGSVINPWRVKDKRSPGGSSGGSAAAVAARTALGTIGTDTGGSIRQPAAFCGIVGLKPTYGRCSRWGIIAFASSLDQAGPLTKTVKDSALMLRAMAGHDSKDSTSSHLDVPNYEMNLEKKIKGLKIGIHKEYQGSGISEDIINSNQKAIEFLKEWGGDY